MRYIIATLLFTFTALSPALVMAQSDSGSVTPQQIRGYRGQSSGSQEKINALNSTANATVLMPVLFGVGVKDISPNFGDPRDGGARTHQGEDIMAVKGTPIVSPTAAVVLHTETGVDEGNAVYTANPGGETFVYMHLDRFGEGVVSGAVLQPGSLIGYVGNTGNASGGAAHLHFEIHNSSGTPTDPFPRLTAEFSPAQKNSFLTAILTQTSDPIALSQFLVKNFRSAFTADEQIGITLPFLITDALATVPAVSTIPSSDASSISPTVSADSLPAGDLDVGSSGAAVIALQKYLIQADSGAKAEYLGRSGATGYFGVITKAALVEYQKAVGITPASGYYGPVTRAYITTNSIAGETPQSSTTSSSTTNSSIVALARDLYRGINNEDVRTLQKLLNANEYTVALTGAGSPGNETTIFGAATEAAVIKFQVAHGISPAAGYVGPLTRSALATL